MNNFFHFLPFAHVAEYLFLDFENEEKPEKEKKNK